MKNKKFLSAMLSIALITPSYITPLFAAGQDILSANAYQKEPEEITSIPMKRVRDYSQGYLHIHFLDEKGNPIEIESSSKGLGDWENSEGIAQDDDNIQINENGVRYVSMSRIFSEEMEKTPYQEIGSVLIDSEEEQIQAEPYFFITEDNSVYLLEADEEFALDSVTLSSVKENGHIANETDLILQMKENAATVVFDLFENLTNEVSEAEEEQANDSEEAETFVSVKWPAANAEKDEEELVVYKRVTQQEVENIELVSEYSVSGSRDNNDGFSWNVSIEDFSQDDEQLLPEQVKVLFNDNTYALMGIGWEPQESSEEDGFRYAGRTEKELSFAQGSSPLLTLQVDSVDPVENPYEIEPLKKDNNEHNNEDNYYQIQAYSVTLDGKRYTVAPPGKNFQEKVTVEDESEDFETLGIVINREDLPDTISIDSEDEAYAFAQSFSKYTLETVCWIHDLGWFAWRTISIDHVDYLADESDPEDGFYRFEIIHDESDTLDWSDDSNAVESKAHFYIQIQNPEVDYKQTVGYKAVIDGTSYGVAIPEAKNKVGSLIRDDIAAFEDPNYKAGLLLNWENLLGSGVNTFRNDSDIEEVATLIRNGTFSFAQNAAYDEKASEKWIDLRIKRVNWEKVGEHVTYNIEFYGVPYWMDESKVNVKIHVVNPSAMFGILGYQLVTSDATQIDMAVLHKDASKFVDSNLLNSVNQYSSDNPHDDGITLYWEDINNGYVFSQEERDKFIADVIKRELKVVRSKQFTGTDPGRWETLGDFDVKVDHQNSDVNRDILVLAVNLKNNSGREILWNDDYSPVSFKIRIVNRQQSSTTINNVAAYKVSFNYGGSNQELKLGLPVINTNDWVGSDNQKWSQAEIGTIRELVPSIYIKDDYADGMVVYWEDFNDGLPLKREDIDAFKTALDQCSISFIADPWGYQNKRAQWIDNTITRDKVIVVQDELDDEIDPSITVRIKTNQKVNWNYGGEVYFTITFQTKRIARKAKDNAWDILAYRLVNKDSFDEVNGEYTQQYTVAANDSVKDSPSNLGGLKNITRWDYVTNHDINGVGVHIEDLVSEEPFSPEAFNPQDFKDQLKHYGLLILLPWYSDGGGWRQVDIKDVKEISKPSKAEEGPYAWYEITVKQTGLTWQWASNQNGSKDIRFIVRVIDRPEAPMEMTEDNELNNIVTDHVADPEGTTVNFYDFWLTGKEENDYDLYEYNDQKRAEVINSGINKDKSFIFSGGWLFQGAEGTDNLGNYYGSWNAYTGKIRANGGLQPRYGIVKNQLEESDDGKSYPVVDVTGKDENNKDLFPTGSSYVLGDREKTLSLDYLFNLENSDYKEVYPNVEGLFRYNPENGLYYFDSNKTFAELNIEQDGTKSSISENKVTLYDAVWTLPGYNNEEGGQFFPFNDWTQLFATIGSGDEIKYEQWNMGRGGLGELKDTDDPINHYFGMTMETTFQQPVNGKVVEGTDIGSDMIFSFSGDDDVWIFIDGVLVGDLGGIHDAVKIDINFATGAITYTALMEPNINNRVVKETNLKQAFIDALGEDNIRGIFKEGTNTFEDNSIHQFNFYYMERGNDVSNCSITSNFQAPFVDRIRKVDENGAVLEGASFDLYAAAPLEATDNNPGYIEGNTYHSLSEFKVINPKSLSEIKFNSLDEYYPILDKNGNEISFADLFNREGTEYFILKEKNTPDGYKTSPDIILQYQESSGTLKVVNKYETGAYASFMTKWMTNESLHKADYDMENGKVVGNEETFEVTKEPTETNEFYFVVPVVKIKQQDDPEQGNPDYWAPIYGSNTYSWKTVDGANVAQSDSDYKAYLLSAALLQTMDTTSPGWYLSYDPRTEGLKGTLENLPGDATRYIAYSSAENADLDLVAFHISGNDLPIAEINEMDFAQSGEQRMKKLQQQLISKLKSITEKDLINQVRNFASHVTLIDTSEQYIQRKARTSIYVPNEQRELRVQKVDPTGRPVPEAVFALFKTAKQANAFDTEGLVSKEEAYVKLQESYDTDNGVVSFGETATIKLETSAEEQEGMLIFRENPSHMDSKADEEFGYAQMSWPNKTGDTTEEIGEADNPDVYWLKEIYAPEGMVLNKNLVRIDVGNSAIYANATGFVYNGEAGVAEALEGNEKENDGIKVKAALGKLAQTLVKYADDNLINTTLQDITIYKQTNSLPELSDEQKMGFIGDWDEPSNVDPFSLHYGLNAKYLTSQYGLHEEGQSVPVFEVDNDYVRVMPRQTPNREHDYLPTDEPLYNEILTDNEINYDYLDLDNLFGLLNVVVIEDEYAPGEEKPELPETGGEGTYLLIFGGAVFVLTGIALTGVYFRKNRSYRI